MGDLRLYIPICKVDKEARTVAGYATTEAIDKQNEVVDYEGSKEAFGNWTKNVREMHEPRAVGKAVEIISDDAKKSIYVKAYISKGAEDTWQKVKEGILTGFSIGGQTVSKVVQVIKDASNTQKQITRIVKYKLNELSLVDNPANPEATLELVKMADDGTLQQTEVIEEPQPMTVELKKDEGATTDLQKSKEGGEETEMTAELAKQLVEKVDAAITRLDEFIKAYSAKTKEIPVKKEEATEKAADPATSSLETQPAEGAYPAKGEITGDTKTDSKGAKVGAKSGDEGIQTQPADGAYPAKGPVKTEATGDVAKEMPPELKAKIEAAKAKDEEDGEAEAEATKATKKSDESTDIKKLTDTVTSLTKRINELETTPMPRKYKVEKTYGNPDGSEPSEEESIKKEYDEVLGWVQSGKELTKEQSAKRDAVLAKMISKKFGGDARKLV